MAQCRQFRYLLIFATLALIPPSGQGQTPKLNIKIKKGLPELVGPDAPFLIWNGTPWNVESVLNGHGVKW